MCEEGGNEKAIEWLLSMHMDLNIQDEKGRTAFMHAVHHWDYENIIDAFLKKNGRHLYLVDNDGHTALFHAAHSTTTIFHQLLKSNIFDYTHINHNHENILLYMAKHSLLKSFNLLLDQSDVDFNLVNNENKNVAMLLAENAHFIELKTLFHKKNINVNYQNRNGDTIVSLFLKKYQQQVKGELGKDYNTEYHDSIIENYAQTLKTLIDIGCDFNCVIDDDGNTPVMFYMIMEDYVSLKYLLDNCDLDLTKKNRYGINAIYLSLFINEDIFSQITHHKFLIHHISYKSVKLALLNHKGFDFDNLDSNHNNLVMNGLIYNDPYTMNYIDRISPQVLFTKNNKNENVIIVATKLGHHKILKKLLSKISGDHQEKEKYYHVNTQNYIGNTALHIAVLMKDKYAVNLLMNNKADPNIRNKNELSAFDLSLDIEDTCISDFLFFPIPIHEMERQIHKNKPYPKDSIINKHITAFQQDYVDLMKKDNMTGYTPSPFNIMLQQRMIGVLYKSVVGLRCGWLYETKIKIR
ncbi:hypothetical protein PIROE2DRAFT_58386 [Piromyces sp. E2]|nr:hypothetical protein PIROE2DRAFT_58386 [Piromyces sp. E2]|eukprot:OUM67992.1 hypothetical protein PIROE2DRAFT_58386 [Piromyces sp. E2]